MISTPSSVTATAAASIQANTPTFWRRKRARQYGHRGPVAHEMRAQLGQTRCGGAPTEPSIRHSLGGRRARWSDAYHRRIREIRARDGVIRLGQLLKLAGFVDSGGEAKALLETGAVLVNGEPETRRGRQLHPGDTVAAGDEIARIV